MRELAATGIVEITSGKANTPDRITLGKSWSWLLAELPAEQPRQASAEAEPEMCELVLAES